MSIAVDQQRLRRIAEALLPDRSLTRAEADTVLQFVRIAAGVDHVDDPVEHSIMQCLAQTVSNLAGIRVAELQPIEPFGDEHARLRWLQRLGAELGSRPVRELTYAFAFLTTVADLRVTPAERDALEEFQHALGLDDRRVTDLVIFVTDLVSATDAVGTSAGA